MIPSAEYMRRARAAILAHGGADAVNSFTRFYLALLGQISYEQCPAVPPEMVLLPTLVSDQPVFGQRLDADDLRAAVDHVGLPADGRDRHRSWASRELFLERPDRLAAVALPGQARAAGPAQLGPFLPHRRSRPAMVQRSGWTPLAAPGARSGRTAG